MKTQKLYIFILLVFFLGCAAQKEEISLKSTRTLLIPPYVEALSDTNAIIMWKTEDICEAIELKYKDSSPNTIVQEQRETLHRVVLKSLKPGTFYFYRLAGTTNQFSTFRTLSQEREKYSFAVLGDNRTRTLLSRL